MTKTSPNGEKRLPPESHLAANPIITHSWLPTNQPTVTTLTVEYR